MRAKSEENWSVGSQCLTNGRLNAAANRFYYAVFQAVLSFAMKKQNYVYKGGAHTQMAQIVHNFGKAASYYGPRYKELMALRETADYDRETPDKVDIEDLLKDASAIRLFYLKEAAN